MVIDLYYHPMSSPCRAVMLTAEALGINFNYKMVDLAASEQLAPEYAEVSNIVIKVKIKINKRLKILLDESTKDNSIYS